MLEDMEWLISIFILLVKYISAFSNFYKILKSNCWKIMDFSRVVNIPRNSNGHRFSLFILKDNI